MSSSTHENTRRAILAMPPSDDAQQGLTEGILSRISRNTNRAGCRAGNNSRRRIRGTDPSEIGSRAISEGNLVRKSRKTNRVGCKLSMKASAALMSLCCFISPVIAAGKMPYETIPTCLRSHRDAHEVELRDKMQKQLDKYGNVLGVKIREISEQEYELVSTGPEGRMLVFRHVIRSNTDMLLYPFTLDQSGLEVSNKRDQNKRYLVQVAQRGNNLRSIDFNMSLESHTTGDESDMMKRFCSGSIVWDSANAVFRWKKPCSHQAEHLVQPKNQMVHVERSYFEDAFFSVGDRLVPDHRKKKVDAVVGDVGSCCDLRILRREDWYDELASYAKDVEVEMPKNDRRSVLCMNGQAYPGLDEERLLARQKRR